MRVRFPFILIFLVLCLTSSKAQEVILAIEDTCADAGATGIVVYITLDNSGIEDDVAGFQFDLYFDKTALTATDVASSPRASGLTIFNSSIL